MSESLAPDATHQIERRRTAFDVVLGILSVLAGIIVLGHVAIAGVISILFIGWMLLLGGVVLAVSAILNWRDHAHRWDLAAGAVFAVTGFAFVRNPAVGLLVLTLVAGSLLLVGGVIRVVAAFQPQAPRALLLTNGVVTLLLGGLVVSGWPESALWLLGTVLGVQLVVDGITTALVGRVRVVETTTVDDAVAPA